jgi:hypothetical protein
MPRFLVVIDTPGIKQFVFGTDALAEVRGASALLDRLNRRETEPLLQEALREAGGKAHKVYANGGTAQFVLEAPDVDRAKQALAALAAAYREQTGGEVRLVWGLVKWPEGDNDYRAAVRRAYDQLRLVRDTNFGCPAVNLLPFFMECQSTSHLPAFKLVPHGGERKLLSHASILKVREADESRRGELWSDWMEHLAAGGDWPDEKRWPRLRAPDARPIGEAAARRGYVGLVYADGNAMGRLVQQLDHRDTCKAFSEIVDGSIRDACYQALEEVCRQEIDQTRQAWHEQVVAAEEQEGRREEEGAPSPPTKPLRVLPPDILLLGGDDLLVLLPADRALPFALLATKAFERHTAARIDDLRPREREFFQRMGLQGRGMTISCGVALGPASYPFYLLLDLAEQLLASAKRGGSDDSAKKGGSDDPAKTAHRAPAYIDFHLIAGAASHDLEPVRRDDYRLADPDYQRTLRPYARDRLQALRQAVARVRRERVPRSKLHALFEAALEHLPGQAARLAREVFSRCPPRQRQALWLALRDLGPLEEFPWQAPEKENGPRRTALADLVEAHDLFPREDLP